MAKTLVLSGTNFVTNKIETVTFGDAIPCSGISLDSASATITGINQTQTLTATPTPVNTTDNITWETSDVNVATVSYGIVTSVGVGSAVITARCGNYSASCTVTVQYFFSGLEWYPDAYVSMTPTYTGGSGLMTYSPGGSKYGLMLMANGDTAAFKSNNILYYPFYLPKNTKRIKITYSSTRIKVNRVIYMSQATPAPNKTYAQVINYDTDITITDNVSIVNIPTYEGFPEVDSVMFWLFTRDNSTFVESDFDTFTIEALPEA